MIAGRSRLKRTQIVITSKLVAVKIGQQLFGRQRTAIVFGRTSHIHTQINTVDHAIVIRIRTALCCLRTGIRRTEIERIGDVILIRIKKGLRQPKSATASDVN